MTNAQKFIEETLLPFTKVLIGSVSTEPDMRMWNDGHATGYNKALIHIRDIIEGNISEWQSPVSEPKIIRKFSLLPEELQVMQKINELVDAVNLLRGKQC